MIESALIQKITTSRSVFMTPNLERCFSESENELKLERKLKDYFVEIFLTVVGLLSVEFKATCGIFKFGLKTPNSSSSVNE